MSIAIVCPNCRASYHLNDALEGKKVRCKKCDEIMLVHRADTPAKGSRTSVSGGRQEDAEETDEQEERGSERKNRSRRLRKKGKSTRPLLIIGSVAGVLLLILIGIGIWALGASKKTASPANSDPRNLVSGASQGVNAGQQPNAAPQIPDLVRAAAIKVPVEYQKGITERVLLGAGGQRAGICVSDPGNNNAHVFDLFDVPAGKRLSRTNLMNIRVPQQMTLSPDGTRLAVAELTNQNKKFETAITVWSLPDGKLLQSSWKPYADDKESSTLGWMTFLDADRLFTVTVLGRMALWDAQGKAIYAIEHKIPGTWVMLTEDPYTKQPQSFSLSADRGSIAISNGVGFDVLDIATGKVRVKTRPFVGQACSVRGVALDRNASRLAVDLWVPGGPGAGIDEQIVVWDLKANEKIGTLPLRLRTEVLPALGDLAKARGTGYAGNALSWWGNDHLLLWSATGSALAIEAASGRPLREVQGPRGGGVTDGQFGFGDPDGRLWYYITLPIQAEAFSCALDFPGDEARTDQGLDGEFYKRWWLTNHGVYARALANDVRTTVFPRVGPAK